MVSGTLALSELQILVGRGTTRVLTWGPPDFKHTGLAASWVGSKLSWSLRPATGYLRGSFTVIKEENGLRDFCVPAWFSALCKY